MIGVCNLLMFAAFADQGAPGFLCILGALLILVSIALITYRSTVRIDGLKNFVEKTIKTLFWKRMQTFSVSDFRGVGIATMSNAVSGRTSIYYFAQLLGPKILNIPGRTIDYQEGLAKAMSIARFLNLPLDEKPRIGIFGGGRL